MNPIPGFRAIQSPENRTVARGWKGCWRRAQDSMQATSTVTMQTLADVVGHQLLDQLPAYSWESFRKISLSRWPSSYHG